MSMLLGLSPAKAQQSAAQIRTIFNSVDTRLADGRNFLVGGRLTLSDIAFAVSAAPAVLPPGYGGPIPPFEEMPPEVQALVTEMRAHPAGSFALRIYREHRYRSSSAVAF
jgi:glutathione S-transferase